MKTETKEIEIISRLERLGFKTSSEELKKLAKRKRQMMIAYEHYRFVTQEKVDAFNNKLRLKGNSAEYSVLDFCPVSTYHHVPPDNVLAEMEVAVDRECFDSFEVAYIRQVKDPILFGRVDGCSDRFFIEQWDDDVKIEDILLPNEG